MNKNEIYNTVVRVLREKVLETRVGNDVEIGMETVLVTELAMDSLDRVLFVDELEEAFDIEIQMEEIASVQTVEDIVDSVYEKLSENSGE